MPSSRALLAIVTVMVFPMTVTIACARLAVRAVVEAADQGAASDVVPVRSE